MGVLCGVIGTCGGQAGGRGRIRTRDDLVSSHVLVVDSQERTADTLSVAPSARSLLEAAWRVAVISTKHVGKNKPALQRLEAWLGYAHESKECLSSDAGWLLVHSAEEAANSGRKHLK